MLEILLGVHGVRSDLNLVLLDEPDSHLHRDLQRRLLDEKQRQIGDERLLRTIEGQRNARRKSLELGLGIHVRTLSSLSTYLPWARLMLAQEFVHHLANKDDVAQLIGDVYRALGLSFSPDGLFERLVASSKPNTRPSAWDELARTIR